MRNIKPGNNTIIPTSQNYVENCMKRLIICNDGTWNTPDQEDNGIPSATNVFKIYNAIADADQSGNQQLKYYHPGVGTEGGYLKKTFGGAFGLGLSHHIQSAYHWLATNYAEGDEVFLFGFSRGAFASRSLAGFLRLGLIQLTYLNPNEAWKAVNQAYDAYRKQRPNLSNAIDKNLTMFNNGQPLPIRFLGVWDTVGALGIPDDLEIINLFDDADDWRFHDTSLGAHIKTARHAMALDEMRACFTVTRWQKSSDNQDAKEIWFPGVHSNVGGGYSNTDLSDGALLWMITESKQCGLAFRADIETQLKPNPCGVLHNSYKGTFAKLRSRPRALDAFVKDNKQLFHESAIKRQQASPLGYPPYHPTTLIQVGGSTTVEIYADTRWNRTGIYLQPGNYYFEAKGEWLDDKDACDWRGTQDDKLTISDILRKLSSAWGSIEAPWKSITGNRSTDFWKTKRVEHLNWFTMVGAITNDGAIPSNKTPEATQNDGSPNPHQYVELSSCNSKSNLLHVATPNPSQSWNLPTPPKAIAGPGYLYCFPNDVWALYDNNHGSIRLTVHRV